MERSAALRGLQTNYLLCPSRRCPSSPPLNSLPLPFADNTLSSLNFQVPLFPLSSLILFGDNSILFFIFLTLFIYCSSKRGFLLLLEMFKRLLLYSSVMPFYQILTGTFLYFYIFIFCCLSLNLWTLK